MKRLGLNKLKMLEPAEPVRRYEREHPGELIHIDIKKLGKFNKIGHRITGDRTGQSNGRGVGWEYVHVCIDDASRIAFSQVMENERQDCAVPFLEAAVAYYKSLGITVQRVMTDNGACYKAHAFARACKRLQIRHIRTKPYTPKTNGKASASSKLHCANGPTQGLPHLRTTRCRVATLAPSLQLAQATRQPKIHAAHQQTRLKPEEPVEAPQLERRDDGACGSTQPKPPSPPPCPPPRAFDQPMRFLHLIQRERPRVDPRHQLPRFGEPGRLPQDRAVMLASFAGQQRQ